MLPFNKKQRITSSRILIFENKESILYLPSYLQSPVDPYEDGDEKKINLKNNFHIYKIIDLQYNKL